MGARFENPRIRVFVAMEYQRLPGSSLMDYAADDWNPEPSPAVLHICRRSTVEALKVYTQISTTKAGDEGRYTDPHINTPYAGFYIRVDKWDNFKFCSTSSPS